MIKWTNPATGEVYFNPWFNYPVTYEDNVQVIVTVAVPTSAGQGYTRRVQGWDSYPYPSRVRILGHGYGYCAGFLGVQQKTCKKHQNLGF